MSTDPNIQQLIRFYTGLAFGRLGLPERAAGEIGEALRLQPASPLTGPAERLREAMVTMREGEKRLGLEVRLGGFYDDNVSVIPQSSPDPLVEALRNQKHTSPGWLGSLRANYSFLRTGPWEATATASVFTAQDNDVNRFSIVDYLGGLGGAYRSALETPLGVFPFQAALQYAYDFLTLGGDEFVTRRTVTPSSPCSRASTTSRPFSSSTKTNATPCARTPSRPRSGTAPTTWRASFTSFASRGTSTC